MKYFLDTEFIEGTQKKWFGQTKPTIDLISIGIVCEDGREYYAISKDFNLKEAWNRHDLKYNTGQGDLNNLPPTKVYWLRDNVLLSIHYELVKRGLDFDYTFTEWKDIITAREHGIYADRHYKTLKKLIKEYGKTNKQITEEIIEFVTPTNEPQFCKDYNGKWDITYQATKRGGSLPQFYGYYSDYDWVVFCWLFGKMNDLPNGFPMYCIDLKQVLDEKALRWCGNIQQMSSIFCDDFESKLDSIKSCKDYPKQTNEHNALADAKWNFELYKFLNKL